MSTGALTCRDVVGLLLDYLEPALSPEVVTALEHHLEDCPPCLAYLRTYERTRRLTGEVTRVEMPEELKERLRALLLAQLGPGRRP
jgi:anti-sigma factor RsiW